MARLSIRTSIPTNEEDFSNGLAKNHFDSVEALLNRLVRVGSHKNGSINRGLELWKPVAGVISNSRNIGLHALVENIITNLVALVLVETQLQKDKLSGVSFQIGSTVSI